MSSLEDLRKLAGWATNKTGLTVAVHEHDEPFRSTLYEPDTWFMVEVGETGVIGNTRGGPNTKDQAASLIEGVVWGVRAAVQLLPIHN